MKNDKAKRRILSTVIFLFVDIHGGSVAILNVRFFLRMVNVGDDKLKAPQLAGLYHIFSNDRSFISFLFSMNNIMNTTNQA